VAGAGIERGSPLTVRERGVVVMSER